MLSGCVAAAVGGAAAGGYYVGKDERTAGEIADDAAITASVKTRLIAERSVRALDINVDTRYKIVTLNGKVSSVAAKNRAIEIAKMVSNVKKVISNLKIVTVEVEESS
jgi:hyperosmotically inducible protein